MRISRSAIVSSLLSLGWRRLVAIALVLAFFASCDMPTSVELQSIRVQRLLPIDSAGWQLEFEARVYNPNPKSIKLEHANLQVWFADSQVATMALQQEVFLPPKSSISVQLPLAIALRTPADALRLGMLATSQSLASKLELGGKVHLKYGSWPYTKRLKRQPLQQIIEQYDSARAGS